MMQAQTCVSILNQVCIVLAFLTMTNTAAFGRPLSHNPPSTPHSSEHTITLYINGVTAEAGVPSSQDPIFSSQGSVGPSNSWLRILTNPGALQPSSVTIIDKQFHGKKEFGLPLVGKLKGVSVTSMTDNSSHIVAMKALFEGKDAGSSLRFFGIHQDDQESHIAVVRGTGRYNGATGFAVVKAADVPERARNVSLSRALSFRVHLK